MLHHSGGEWLASCSGHLTHGNKAPVAPWQSHIGIISFIHNLNYTMTKKAQSYLCELLAYNVASDKENSNSA
jgi:hypothetical protein